MRILFSIKWACGVALLMQTFSASAVLVSYDGFDYPTGSAAGRSGGFGFTGGYFGNGAINADTFEYVDSGGSALPSIGNHFSTNTNGNGVFRTLSTAGLPEGILDQTGRFGVDGSHIYISFLTRLDSGRVVSFGDYGGISLFDGTREELFIGDPGFSGLHVNWGLDPQEGEAAMGESNVPVNSTVHLLVGRIDFLFGFEVVRLYIDPPLDAEPAAATVAPLVMHNFRFNRIRIQSGGNGRYSFDEFHIGTSYRDVVPEPSVGGLLAVASLTAFGRRRRRE